MSRKKKPQLDAYARWVREHYAVDVSDYESLWKWSTSDIDSFWKSIWQYFDVKASSPYHDVLGSRAMPGAAWFPGARLNYAENMLVAADSIPDDVAVFAISQTRPDELMTFGELRSQVARAAEGLRRLGVRSGDRVVGYLPNIPEALIAFLAAASIGATWASVSPEFGARAVTARFAQIRPTVLLAVSGYDWGKRSIDKTSDLRSIRAELTSLRAVVMVPYGRHTEQIGDLSWPDLIAEYAPLEYEQVSFDHPLCILYSSGTTGLPKAIIHGHGGILLEHLKLHALHLDTQPGDRLMWITTTAWTMWNILVSALLLQSGVVLFDGDPISPDAAAGWRVANRRSVTLLGISPGYVNASRESRELVRGWLALRTVGVTGAPLSGAGARWLHDHLGADVRINSISGGTDVCSAFVGGNPWLPDIDGELSGPCLGIDVAAVDTNGRELINELGEMVVRQPMPSMPVGLWSDPKQVRYTATYFEKYPGIWRHGDWIVFKPERSCVIAGRSDATLNRGGVRLGTSDFYSVLEDLPEVEDSLVVHLEDAIGDGPGELLLYVVLAPGVVFEPALQRHIKSVLRRELSPRHIPDRITAVPAVPRTLTGKKLEAPIKQILLGRAPEAVLQQDAVTDYGAIAAFLSSRERTGHSIELLP